MLKLIVRGIFLLPGLLLFSGGAISQTSEPVMGSVENDTFKEVAAAYLAANPKPQLPEEARKYKVQAEFAIQEKQFDKAIGLYGKALEIAPWWPQGYFNQALILGETKKYWDAMREMRRYLLLVPNAADARAAQDRIYQWEGIAGPEPQDFRDCADCPIMVMLPGNGSSVGKFAIGKYDVTFDQWDACVTGGGCNSYHPDDGPAPSIHWGRGNRPVIKVSWEDANSYAQWLSIKTGKHYRLPSEAEWEYAARAGTTTEHYWGNEVGTNNANCNGCGSQWDNQMTAPVGSFKPNPFGLYDMLGNLYQWTDACRENDCGYRILRGGSWHDLPQVVRPAFQGWIVLSNRSNNIGFRLARMLP